MNTEHTNSPIRQATINGLAVVGFVVLVVAGVWLAVSSTPFVPTVVNRIGSAAVYLGSIFNPAPEPALTVIPTETASTTISFGTTTPTTATTTTVSTAVTTTVTTPPAPKPVAKNPGTKTIVTYPVGSTPVAPYGLSDLVVHISTIGYLTTNSTDSFVGSATVPSGELPAIKFTIKNTGTNWSGVWRFSASIPTRTTYLFQSEPQQSLAPGDSIDYILGFDRAQTGSNQVITITANSNSTAAESNTNNNTASATLTIR